MHITVIKNIDYDKKYKIFSIENSGNAFQGKLICEVTQQPDDFDNYESAQAWLQFNGHKNVEYIILEVCKVS